MTFHTLGLYCDLYYINNFYFLVAESECYDTIIPKSTVRLDPKPVPFISHPHNVYSYSVCTAYENVTGVLVSFLRMDNFDEFNEIKEANTNNQYFKRDHNRLWEISRFLNAWCNFLSNIVFRLKESDH